MEAYIYGKVFSININYRIGKCDGFGGYIWGYQDIMAIPITVYSDYSGTISSTKTIASLYLRKQTTKKPN